MTTRAIWAGLLGGLAATLVLFYPLWMYWQDGSTPLYWIAMSAAAILTIGAGSLAGRWAGSVSPIRRAALGGLSGALAGTLVYCLPGAAAAGLSSPAGTASLVARTQLAFLACFAAGSALGALGGWLSHPRPDREPERFDHSDPQMAMNFSITAAPASVVAAALAVWIFPRLAGSLLPLLSALLLVLVSQLALTLVIPHEAREAEHLCGMDEVKMAAYVSIGTAPVLTFFLVLVEIPLLTHPLVAAALLLSATMSLFALRFLVQIVLPGRSRFPAPRGEKQQAEAKWFGSISQSRGPRLVVLCIACGLAMILPLHVTAFSVLINLQNLPAGPVTVETARRLFLAQALTSTGLMAASCAALTILYLSYLSLGRWFSRRG
jgi:hypothetical protein